MPPPEPVKPSSPVRIDLVADTIGPAHKPFGRDAVAIDAGKPPLAADRVEAGDTARLSLRLALGLNQAHRIFEAAGHAWRNEFHHT